MLAWFDDVVKRNLQFSHQSLHEACIFETNHTVTTVQSTAHGQGITLQTLNVHKS